MWREFAKMGFGALLVAGLGLAGLVSYCYHAENVVLAYTSPEERAQDSARADGLIGAVVPRAATNIRAVTNLDSNEQWIRFQLDSNALDAFRSALLPIPARATRRPRRVPPRWDGPWLTEGPTGRQHQYYRLVDFEKGAYCVAIGTTNDLIFAWTCEGV